MREKIETLLNAFIVVSSAVVFLALLSSVLKYFLPGGEWIVSGIFIITGTWLVYMAMKPKMRYFSVCFYVNDMIGNIMFAGEYYTAVLAGKIVRESLRDDGDDIPDDCPITIISCMEVRKEDFDHAKQQRSRA